MLQVYVCMAKKFWIKQQKQEQNMEDKVSFLLMFSWCLFGRIMMNNVIIFLMHKYYLFGCYFCNVPDLQNMFGESFWQDDKYMYMYI